jgi:hypothetical protein
MDSASIHPAWRGEMFIDVHHHENSKRQRRDLKKKNQKRTQSREDAKNTQSFSLRLCVNALVL